MIVVLAVGLSPADARASEASEVEALRREIAQLRVQIHTLRSALAEPAEGERPHAASEPAPPAPAAPAPAPATAADAPAAPATTADKRRRRPAKVRRQRRAGRTASSL
jgi:hypothetical protein